MITAVAAMRRNAPAQGALGVASIGLNPNTSTIGKPDSGNEEAFPTQFVMALGRYGVVFLVMETC